MKLHKKQYYFIVNILKNNNLTVRPFNENTCFVTRARIDWEINLRNYTRCVIERNDWNVKNKIKNTYIRIYERNKTLVKTARGSILRGQISSLLNNLVLSSLYTYYRVKFYTLFNGLIKSGVTYATLQFHVVIILRP